MLKQLTKCYWVRLASLYCSVYRAIMYVWLIRLLTLYRSVYRAIMYVWLIRLLIWVYIQVNERLNGSIVGSNCYCHPTIVMTVSWETIVSLIGVIVVKLPLTCTLYLPFSLSVFLIKQDYIHTRYFTWRRTHCSKQTLIDVINWIWQMYVVYTPVRIYWKNPRVQRYIIKANNLPW